MSDASDVSDVSEAPKLLELEGVSFSDGGGFVLDDVSLFVREGESVGVSFAQVHAGKTSLLYIAAGLRAPTRGTVRFAGKRIDPEGPPLDPPGMGLVFRDDGGLFPNYTLFDNVALPLRYHDWPDADDRARAALEEVGLGPCAERFPWELTRERMRLAALARALVYEPRIVLVDDFFPGRDDEVFGRALEAILRAKEKRGTAFLLIVEGGQTEGIDRRICIDGGHVV